MIKEHYLLFSFIVRSSAEHSYRRRLQLSISAISAMLLNVSEREWRAGSKYEKQMGGEG